MENKTNTVSLIAGIFMIIVSTLNYLMNEDHVTLGIFIFAGIGFILLGIKNKFGEESSKRVNKYGMTFFYGAIIILLYWLAKTKLNLF
ncbi:MAG: hypothetical protein L3J35_11690 [Bacteroidales bacterium]|nr:hypothetical protein [Bacteroidales bacterium]